MRGACQVADLTLMIRATRGRSRRPNHMRSPLDALQTPPPVNFRRLAGDFHNAAKQASLNIAFGMDLEGFGRPRWLLKFDFRASFFDVIFDCVSVSPFGRLLDAPNQKSSNFPLEKQ